MKTLIGIVALAAGVAAAFYVVSLRSEPSPAWPNKKKLRKDARRAGAEARRLAAQTPSRPPKVKVEREAQTDLKVPLGDLTR